MKTLLTSGVSEVLEATSIIPYHQNAKLHTPEQIAELACSIGEKGYYQEIVVDETGVILAGHGRLEAVKKLGYTKVGVRRISGLTEVQKRELRLNDNLLNSMTGYDLEFLKLEQEEIAELGGSLELLGLNAAKLEAISFDESKNYTSNNYAPKNYTPKGYTIGQNQEIDVENLEQMGKITFTFGGEIYEKALHKINAIRQQNSLNSNEDVLLFLLDL